MTFSNPLTRICILNSENPLLPQWQSMAFRVSTETWFLHILQSYWNILGLLSTLCPFLVHSYLLIPFVQPCSNAVVSKLSWSCTLNHNRCDQEPRVYDYLFINYINSVLIKYYVYSIYNYTKIYNKILTLKRRKILKMKWKGKPCSSHWLVLNTPRPHSVLEPPLWRARPRLQ